MDRIPPTAEIVAAAQFVLAPSAIAAVGLVLPLGTIAWVISHPRNWNWRRAMPAVFVLAFGLSLVMVNHFRGDTQNYIGSTFPWVPDGKWWHFGGWAVAASILAEWICRVLPSRSIGFLLRGLTSGVIAHFIVPVAWQTEARWWLPTVAAWLALSWSIVAEVSRRQPGVAVALAVSIFAGGTGVFLLHAKSLGLSDLAIAAAVSLFVLAILAWFTKSDAGSAATAAIVPMLIFIWLNRPLAESDVPLSCHRILAAVPLFCGLLLVPPINRLAGSHRGGISIIVLTTIPIVLAVAIAATVAPMTFDEEKW